MECDLFDWIWTIQISYFSFIPACQTRWCVRTALSYGVWNLAVAFMKYVETCNAIKCVRTALSYGVWNLAVAFIKYVETFNGTKSPRKYGYRNNPPPRSESKRKSELDWPSTEWFIINKSAGSDSHLFLNNVVIPWILYYLTTVASHFPSVRLTYKISTHSGQCIC